jgi:pimeloyl-ACP methyl ester carboxylesterase
MRISDVASENPAVRGLVFLGFHGRGFRDMVDWQAYERPVELFVRPDVDTDRDGFVTRDEASKWPNDFSYPWKDGETRISIAVYAQYLRSVPETRESIEALASMPLYSNGFWGRPPTYQKVAALSIPILAFTGSLDVMTPPSELEALESALKDVGKVDCETHLIQGVGHGFSAPRPPRGHALLDKTEGPVDPRFLELFTQALSAWRPGVRPKQSPM